MLTKVNQPWFIPYICFIPITSWRKYIATRLANIERMYNKDWVCEEFYRGKVGFFVQFNSGKTRLYGLTILTDLWNLDE